MFTSEEQLTSINGFTVFFSSSLFLQIGKGEDDLLHFTERSCIRYPVVPGHEIAGVIHTVGSDVPMTCPLVAGDRVVVYPWVGCGECKVCMKGDSNYCPDWVNSRELGFTLDGGYAEYVKVPHYRYIFKLPEAIPFSTGALLPCSGLTAYAALKKCSTVVQRVQGWEKEVIIAVIGLGGVGQWAVKLIPFCFGRESVKVVGIDISSKKLQAAKEEKLVDEIFQFSSEKATSQQACELFKDLKDKPQVILDFVNSTETFSLCVGLLAKMGVHVAVGLHGGLGELQLPLLALSGSAHVGNLVGSVGEMEELLELVCKEGVGGLVVKEYRLSAAGQALQDLEKGLLEGRAILNMQ